MGGRTGAENLAQLQCGIWLVALPARGGHAFPPPNSDWMVDTFAWILRWISQIQANTSNIQ